MAGGALCLPQRPDRLATTMSHRQKGTTIALPSTQSINQSVFIRQETTNKKEMWQAARTGNNFLSSFVGLLPIAQQSWTERRTEVHKPNVIALLQHRNNMKSRPMIPLHNRN